jgi:pimeloyl-ACP methyl ester carboxylesterase
LSAGGLYPGYPEQCNQINFAPRIRIPTLFQGGKYDPVFPLETSQKPYFRLFGTADKDKRHMIYETGHNLWSGHQWINDQLEFLDQHLGRPAN